MYLLLTTFAVNRATNGFYAQKSLVTDAALLNEVALSLLDLVYLGSIIKFCTVGGCAEIVSKSRGC